MRKEGVAVRALITENLGLGSENFVDLKIPRQCPLVLLVNVD
jgi:bisphosphoglycerate-dependent phosphoglycerate mutase